MKAAIATAYVSVCDAVLSQCASNGWTDGACVIACLIVNDIVYVINLGDSKVCPDGFVADFW